MPAAGGRAELLEVDEGLDLGRDAAHVGDRYEDCVQLSALFKIAIRRLMDSRSIYHYDLQVTCLIPLRCRHVLFCIIIVVARYTSLVLFPYIA